MLTHEELLILIRELSEIIKKLEDYRAKLYLKAND
jgi:hypothetical protein